MREQQAEWARFFPPGHFYSPLPSRDEVAAVFARGGFGPPFPGVDLNETGQVARLERFARFYAHESCGQCTQCREGTAWTTKIMERIVAGQGTFEDLDTLLELADNMTGKTICVLSDSCATVVTSGLQKFRHEFEALITGRRSSTVSMAVA
jgi:hypothetical protein